MLRHAEVELHGHTASPDSSQQLAHQAPAGKGLSDSLGWPTVTEKAIGAERLSHTSSISRLPGWLRLKREGSLL